MKLKAVLKSIAVCICYSLLAVSSGLRTWFSQVDYDEVWIGRPR